MLDFGALPPEINSGRMYVGAGSGPLVAAGVAWDELAVELQSVAASYGSAIEGLTVGPWMGASSVAMAAAMAPYVAWIGVTGTQAEQAAAAARMAAGAYEAAFAAMVPPPVIAANRSLLMTLIATNLFGQNTPAIFAAEAHYVEMWAQDAAAMYAYAGSSATASRLAPFTNPPQTVDGPASAAQSVASTTANADLGTQLSELINSVPTALHSLATTVLSSPSTGSQNALAGLALPQLTSAALPSGLSTDLANWNTIWSALTGSYSLQGWTSIPGGPFLSFGQAYAWGQNGQGVAAYLAGPKAISGALAPIADSLAPHVGSAGLGAGPVSGALGRAAAVGSLSVPQGWTQAAPAIKTLASVLSTELAGAPAASFAGPSGAFGEMALSSLAGRALAASAFSGASGSTARTLGAVVTEADPATATIIVIPVLEE